MDELVAVIDQIGTDQPPSDEQLTDTKTELATLLDEALTAPRDMEAARAIREAIDKIDAEFVTRTEDAKKEDEEAAKLLEGVKAEEADPDESEGDENAEAEEAEEVEAPEAVAVAANLAKATRRVRSRIEDNPPAPERSDVRVRGIGAAQGMVNDQSTMDDVARVFADLQGDRNLGRQSLVHLDFEYPKNRQLRSKEAVDNTRLIDAVFSEENLTFEAVGAAGGICGPLEADFSSPICGDRGRPIRDGLTRFNASRGGIRYNPSASLADVVGGITVWPIETDESPGAEVKECLVIDCDTDLEAKVDAVVACLQIGNFQARFNPEFWRSRLDLLMVAHDRIAEQLLHTDITALSTAVTYTEGNGTGTVYTVLSAIDRAVAGISSRLRLNRSTGYRVILADWVHQALRTQVARQRFGGDGVAQLALADATIDAWFRARRVTPIWSLDVDVFGAQGAGALLDWPGGTTTLTVFPEGTFMFLDGGTLDLGTEIVDSTLNQTNDRQAFLETFEKVVFRGCQSLQVTVEVGETCICPDVLELTS